jgi:cGMP-dependent protein kinase
VQALVKMQMVTNLDRERAAMIDCQSSFSVRLLATYQDPHYVYMLMEPGMGGDLRQYTLRLPNARLPETHVKFYVACCVQVPERDEWTGWAHTGGGNALVFKQPT